MRLIGPVRVFKSLLCAKLNESMNVSEILYLQQPNLQRHAEPACLEPKWIGIVHTFAHCWCCKHKHPGVFTGILMCSLALWCAYRYPVVFIGTVMCSLAPWYIHWHPGIFSVTLMCSLTPWRFGITLVSLLTPWYIYCYSDVFTGFLVYSLTSWRVGSNLLCSLVLLLTWLL